MAVGYALGQKKRITVDGARRLPSPTPPAARGPASTFFPDDIRVVKGAPADRREFLDGLLSSLRPAYARAAVEYAKAVQQRNQLLGASGTGSPPRARSRRGTEGRRTRGDGPPGARQPSAPRGEHFIDALRALYGPEKAAIRYGYSALEEYSEALREAHSADIERGTTSVGPHRDDFEVLLGGVDLTTYGSQGQQIATLALKFASRDHVGGETGRTPILLFDDVMSELDERRREYLAGYFLESTQAVISTTNLEYFDEEI